MFAFPLVWTLFADGRTRTLRAQAQVTIYFFWNARLRVVTVQVNRTELARVALRGTQWDWEATGESFHMVSALFALRKLEIQLRKLPVVTATPWPRLVTSVERFRGPGRTWRLALNWTLTVRPGCVQVVWGPGARCWEVSTAYPTGRWLAGRPWGVWDRFFDKLEDLGYDWTTGCALWTPHMLASPTFVDLASCWASFVGAE